MAAAHPRSPAPRAVLARLSRFGRGVCGSASLELAIGCFVLISIAMLAFDFYALVKADAAGARMAVTMADYLSFETAPDGDEIADLGRYLHERELGVPAVLVYVISAVRQPPGDAPSTVLWEDDSIRFGDDEATASLVEDCRRRSADSWRDKLIGDGPYRFGLDANEVIFVVEVCARPLREGMLTASFVSGDIYHLHAAPARDPTRAPERPTGVGALRRRRIRRPPGRPEAQRGGRRRGPPPAPRPGAARTLPADTTAPARLAGNPSTIHRSE